LGQREQEKIDQQRMKILTEKEARDRQLHEEKRRKRRDEKDVAHQESEIVSRLQ